MLGNKLQRGRRFLCNTFFFAIFCQACLFVFSSCRSLQPQTIQTSHKDSIIVQTRIDSVQVMVRDSVYVREKGDTVFVDRWHTQFRDRVKLQVDTIYKADIQHEERVAYVRSRNWYDKATACGFWLLFAALVVYIAIKIVKLYLKSKSL